VFTVVGALDHLCFWIVLCKALLLLVHLEFNGKLYLTDTTTFYDRGGGGGVGGFRSVTVIGGFIFPSYYGKFVAIRFTPSTLLYFLLMLFA
jgi:hypothetical protein